MNYTGPVRAMFDMSLHRRWQTIRPPRRFAIEEMCAACLNQSA